MKKIGFIGVGIMGKSMVRNLMKAGFELHIYARTRSKVEEVISEGAIFHETIADCVKDCDAVITIVGFPVDVEEVYFDKGNILDSAKEGAYLIDMTTTSPMLDQKIAEEGTKRGFHVLDAPVTGGDTGAKAGTLSILVGGSREDYEACIPLFKAMGTNINYQGAAGSGQHAKLANQIMIAGTLSGVCEALTYAKAKGLDLQTVLNSVSTGAAGSKQLDTFGPKILAGDYAPGFFMKHFIKDMKLALTEANMSNISLDVLSQVLANYEMLQAEGYGDLGTQALIKYYEEEDGRVGWQTNRRTASMIDVQTSLCILIKMMHAHYDRKVILLLDEYDVPVAKASDKGYYAEMMEVMKTVMSTSLKDNPSLEFAVVTGCLKIAKESIFTGTNNFVSDTIAATGLDEYFGFTQDDIDKMLQDADIDAYAAEVKEWYDGYILARRMCERTHRRKSHI